MLKFFKSRSKITVKVTCLKFMIPSERSCHKVHKCQYERLISKGKTVMVNVKVF